MESIEHAEGYCYPFLVKLIHDSIPDIELTNDDSTYVTQENPEVNTISIKDTVNNREFIIRIGNYDSSLDSNLTIFADETVDGTLRGNILLSINTLIGMINLTYSILKKKYPDIVEYTEVQYNSELNIMLLDNNERSKYTIQIDIIN